MINTLLGRASPEDVGFYCIKILSTNYSSYSSLSISDSVSPLVTISDSLFSKSSSIWLFLFFLVHIYILLRVFKDNTFLCFNNRT